MVEFLTGIIFLLFYKHFGLGIVYYFHIVLISSFICIAFIDYDHQIIPDELILFGFTLGIGYKLVLYFWMEQPIQILNSIWGLLLGGGFFLLIAILSNGGMGGGDIKLMAMVGFWFGWKDVIFITFFSFVIGSILSIILLLMKKKSRKDAIPFGPFIVMATLITMLYKEQLLYWYWRHFFMNH